MTSNDNKENHSLDAGVEVAPKEQAMEMEVNEVDADDDVVKISDTFHPTKHDGYALIDFVETTDGAKKLLHSMKVIFPVGSVTAILGPSGAGKSTFLSVLTDSLSMNSQASATVHLPGDAAFVPQDDRLHGFYTVKSYMKHYARLSGLSSAKETSLDNKIDYILSQLGLTEQANTLVGDLFLKGLSGGQKRRLSIALEALSDPNTFVLDEPTSGLDAESALQVMEFLRNYVRGAGGRRVILTIHQPSTFIWQRIDNVVLLSKGKLMYQGSRINMESYFRQCGHGTPDGWNSPDHYVTMVNDEFRNHAKSVEEWSQLYKNWELDHHLGGKNSSSSAFFVMSATNNKGGVTRGLEAKSASMANVETMGVVPTSRRKDPISSVLELTYRYFLNLWFNPGILFTRVAMYCMLALLVGALFWKLGEADTYESIISRAAILFYCVAFFIFMSVAVLPFTVIERDIVDKEVLNNYYHPIAYQLAQGLASIPAAALLAALVSLIVVTMLQFQDPGWYFLNMFLALLVSEALAQLVSHMVPHFVIGMALLAAMFGFFMLVQGFMLIPSDFPAWLRWTHDIAFHTYSWRSFMLTEFTGREFPGTPFPTGEDVLAFYEIDDVNREADMYVLFFYCLIVHLFSFVVLQVRHTCFGGKILPSEIEKNGNIIVVNKKKGGKNARRNSPGLTVPTGSERHENTRCSF